MVSPDTEVPKYTELQDEPDDVPEPAVTVPDNGASDEGGKLKMIIQLVKKCFGVKDIASMRLSLPASLLEPIPNLEYWHYLDRPDVFVSINDSQDAFERMLAVLRFTFTKDLKFVHGKVCKPYNSVLGETFRAHWDVVPSASESLDGSPEVYATPSAAASGAAVDKGTGAPSETASVKSGKSSKSTRSRLSIMSKGPKTSSTARTSPASGETHLEGQISDLNLGDGSSSSGPRVRVVYITEQVSHHPPVSAYYATCPDRHIEMSGVDQISAKVSGTSVRVSPGSFNKGIFVKLTGGPGEGELYRITHPAASVNGILRGNFYITVADTTVVTCSGGKAGEKLRAVIEYKEESWLGKPLFRLEGVIHAYNEENTEHEDWVKVKHVPQSRVLATFEGSWKEVITWRRSPAASGPPSAASSKIDVTHSASEPEQLVDLSTLRPIPKSVRPLDRQLPHESRRLWNSVTNGLIKKEFGEANKHKQAIEQRQRDEAAERKKKGIEWIPKYFDEEIKSGIPKLTLMGQELIREELEEPSAFCQEVEEEAQETQQTAS